MALFSRAKSAIYRAWSRGYLTQAVDLAAFTSADFLAAESSRNVGAPFLDDGLCRRDAEAVYAQMLRIFDLRQTCRGHTDGDLAVARLIPLPGCERICWFAPA
jgi:hypothetical protein